MNGEDILFAMTSLGFENYAEALKIYLSKYREVMFPLDLPELCGRKLTDNQQSQSNRGENQARPNSQGYPSGAPGGSGSAPNANFQTGEQPAGLGEAGESYMYSQSGHNGATGETY